MENQGEKYQYSQPLSMTFTTPGSFQKRVEIPFGHECEVAIEWLNLTTQDSSLLVTVDNDPQNMPNNGPINGYLVTGSGMKNTIPIYQKVSQYVWLMGVVGATNAAVNVILRFRRAHDIMIPVDRMHAFTSGE